MSIIRWFSDTIGSMWMLLYRACSSHIDKRNYHISNYLINIIFSPHIAIDHHIIIKTIITELKKYIKMRRRISHYYGFPRCLMIFDNDVRNIFTVKWSFRSRNRIIPVVISYNNNDLPLLVWICRIQFRLRFKVANFIDVAPLLFAVWCSDIVIY